ncbi:germacrene A synthase-like [Primulina eburnea]|uniref:germacrene A synthase-like n=1 Tax=Primulina eburnea TaxID=1245227 RepID=UPI003C6C44B6
MAPQVFNSKNEICQAKPSFPSLWGDMFLYENTDAGVQVNFDESIAELSEEVRKMVMAKESKTTDKIVLIDNIQRLGLSYHFEKEIEEQLEQIFHESSGSNFKAMENYDMFNTALLFRLFRQHGHNIPCGVFDKFKHADNKFFTSLESDIKGLLSFYEATDVRIQGENVLEEAVAFTTCHLNNILTSQADFSVREKVSQTLEKSIHCGVPIAVARYYIPIYEKEESNDKLLVRLAKLNFRYLQNLYQTELSHLITWWKDLDMLSKVPYMRDRVVESYFWGVAMDYEPQYSSARLIVAKSVLLTTMLDDTYDTYATLEDLEIFTQVLQSGKINEIDCLPNYFKEIYQFISRIYEDFDNKHQSKENIMRVLIIKKRYLWVPNIPNLTGTYAGSSEVKQLYMAYHMEANWYRRKRLPAFEDVLSLGVVTSLLFVFATSSFLNGPATEKDFEWLMSKPKIAVASAHVGRYWNDQASYEREYKINGESQTAVDCYMKQYGVLKEEALHKFVELAEDSWMTVNKEWVETVSVPRHALKPILNYSRGVLATYKKEKDGYTFPEKSLKPLILAVFLDPIII